VRWHLAFPNQTRWFEKKKSRNPSRYARRVAIQGVRRRHSRGHQITGWLPGGGSTFNAAADARRRRMRAGRWEFVGIKAPERIRKRYVGRYLGDQFRQGGRKPVRYVNL